MSFAAPRPGSARGSQAGSRPGTRGSMYDRSSPVVNRRATRPLSAPRFRGADTVDYPGSPLERASSRGGSPVKPLGGPSTVRMQVESRAWTPSRRPSSRGMRPSSARQAYQDQNDHDDWNAGDYARPVTAIHRPSSARREPLRATTAYGASRGGSRFGPDGAFGAGDPFEVRGECTRPWTSATRPFTASGIGREQAQKHQPGPPKAGAYTVRKELMKPSLLRRFYDRGDLPISVKHMPNDNRIQWKVDIEKLDYHYYLPIFFDGIREIQEPYAMFARRGIIDMLEHGPGRVVAVLPQLIVPIKNALNTRQPDIVERTLKILQAMVQCDERIGECLVPYYRQLLPIFNLLKNKNTNLGDRIDYNQRNRKNVGDLVNETLEMFEMYGGHDAFINIKYMVPTYESCMVT